MKPFTKQSTPLILTVCTFLALTVALFFFIHVLNLFPIQDKIALRFFWGDILVGLTIYLKTSVDFALFIGKLMSKNSGIKSRIAIEIGTALGNGFGTLFVLALWTFFKEIPLLMIAMIFVASLVLLQLAEEGIEEIKSNSGFILFLKNILQAVNKPFSPFLHILLPKTNAPSKKQTVFVSLLLFSFTIPLLLGLDDFAGYIPLFNIINVFGFAIGVFLGHMLLNLALFASPTTTITLVRKPMIALFGSLAFIGIALWGFVEIATLIQRAL